MISLAGELVPMDDQIHDNRPQCLDGIDLQAAADELRAILAEGGKGKGIVSQLGALTIWAKKTGRKTGRSFDLSQARLGGLEHYVWQDDVGQVVRKFTIALLGKTPKQGLPFSMLVLRTLSWSPACQSPST